MSNKEKLNSTPISEMRKIQRQMLIYSRFFDSVTVSEKTVSYIMETLNLTKEEALDYIQNLFKGEW